MKLLRMVGCPLALAAALLFTVGCGGEEESTDTSENSTPATTSTDGEMVMVSLELPGMT